MLNAIIVDDEKPALDVLKFLLEKTGQICVVGSFSSASDALWGVHSLKPDVAFLDIEMPEMSGLELAQRIIETGNNIEIVFISAYGKYALEAFRVNAIDYILKPISLDDILQTITRLKKVITPKSPTKVPEDKGRIYCFGRFLVYGAGSKNPVRWRTAKAEELFAFMLQNLNNEVSKWKITQVLWPEYETEKLNSDLHTTVYQVKKTLIAANIKFNFTFINGRYKLELPEVYIDAAEFETATNSEIELSAESVKKYKKTLSLYKGNYLEENQYLWSQRKAEEYLIRYRSLISEFIKYYASKKNYANVEKILRNALINVPLDDDINEMLLKLLTIKKDKAAFVIHYSKIKELYESELGILPNKAMYNLFVKALEL